MVSGAIDRSPRRGFERRSDATTSFRRRHRRALRGGGVFGGGAGDIFTAYFGGQKIIDKACGSVTVSVCVDVVCWGCAPLLNHSSGGNWVAQQLLPLLLDFRDLEFDRRWLPKSLEKIPGDFSVRKQKTTTTNEIDGHHGYDV